MKNIVTYRCTLNCPIRKSCIIIKLDEPLATPLNAVYKCKALKKEIPITIGDPVRPP